MNDVYFLNNVYITENYNIIRKLANVAKPVSANETGHPAEEGPENALETGIAPKPFVTMN